MRSESPADGAAPLRFGVLGPAVAWRDGAELRVGSAKHGRLLAGLLLHEGERVAGAELVRLVWGDRPPRSAGNLVQKYVGDVRRALGADAACLASVSGGYRLTVPGGRLDAVTFCRLLDDARRADEERLLTDAVALWRGVAYQELESEDAETERARLDELYVSARQQLAELVLRRGDHAEAVAELGRLTAEHPLRERLRELQMLALYRAGRQADALEVYAGVRRLLADEVGVDPGEPLRDMHERILRGDPSLGGPVRVRPAPACQLPPDVPDFTGRDGAVDTLTRTLTAAGREGALPVAVVSGGPGVGKSTLAVHVAHRLRGTFPDGQVYVDLAGTSDQPRTTGDLLTELLRLLGTADAAIPAGLQERVAFYRSALAGSRVLLVLDDAGDAAQVRPLLPSAGPCGVVVTSRQPLADLAGARLCRLDVLPPADAARLLAGIVGEQRMVAESEQAAVLLRSCGYLPLAIRIAGAKLASRPTWPVRVLRERLDDESRRLGELQVGELGVRASFDLSRRMLPENGVRALALLSQLGAQTVPGWVLGPLLAADDTDPVLDALVDAGLLQLTRTDPTGAPRYRLHDLLRAYGAELAAAIPLEERRAAIRRLLGGWLYLTETAAVRLPPSLLRPARGTAPRVPVPGVTVADPLPWFDAERDALLGGVRLAASWHLSDLTWELAAAAVPYYDHSSVYEDWRSGHRAALRSVRTAGDERGEGVLLCGLAQLHLYRDDYARAVTALSRARTLFERTGDRRGDALAIALLGTVARFVDNPDEALAHTHHALRIARAVGDHHLEAQLLTSSALTRLGRGELADAERTFDEALAMSRTLGDTHREAIVLRGMSELYERGGRTVDALHCLHRASTTFREIHDERCDAYALLGIGRIHARQGATPAGTELRHAANVFHRHGDRRAEMECWQLLGEYADPDPVRSRQHLDRAARLRRQLAAARPAGPSG